MGKNAFAPAMSIRFRPRFHFSPPSGWMNDPNGLVYSQGWWHLFYQHEPHQLKHGPMHWGHAASRDLFNWEARPIAFYPDELGTIWSGSAAQYEQEDGAAPTLVACYTQADTPRGQIQSLAFSRDGGTTWAPSPRNPVLTSQRPDFRDPKIFRHGQEWRMVVSGGHEAHFYASPDLLNWTLLSTFPSPHAGWIWECPDLLEVDGQWVLLVSFIIPDGGVTAGSQTHYWIGDFDGTRFHPHSEMRRLSFGPDDYAAVSWSDAPDARKVLIGWMSQWGYADRLPTEGENWRGAMTLPRELSLVDGVLRQNPPRELRALRGEAIAFDESGLDAHGETFEIEAEIDVSNLRAPEVGFHLRVGPDEATKVLFNVAEGTLTLDRTRAGQSDFHPEFATAFSAPLALQDGIFHLHLFVDRCSVEVFAGEGALYGAALIFPSPQSQGIAFIGEGAHVRRGVFTPLS